jgi:DNA polymerase-3 subunit beta
MKILCEQNNLINGINIVLKAVPSKTTMEILECIKIKATDNKITFTGNDMSLGIETIIEGEIIEEGITVVNAKIFSDFIRSLPSEEVVLETDKETLNIRCGKIKFNVPVRNASDYPELPQISKDKSAVMSQQTLRNMIRQTVFSISADNEAMKIMTGELLEIKGRKLRLVALDGHRISLRNVELNEEYEDVKVIIPGKTLNELVKILSGEFEDKVTIYFSENHVLFEITNTIILSRLIEGEYYLVDRMISGDYETKVNVNKRRMSECIDRALLLIKENDKKPLIFNFNDDLMDVKIRTQIGYYEDRVDTKKEGNDIVIAFSPKFLSEALRVIDDEDINIYMMNVKSPCIIKDDDETYMYLILPVNFNAE